MKACLRDYKFFLDIDVRLESTYQMNLVPEYMGVDSYSWRINKTINCWIVVVYILEEGLHMGCIHEELTRKLLLSWNGK